MLKRLDFVLESRKFVREWPEKSQFLVKIRQIWNDFRHCAGSKSFFSSLLNVPWASTFDTNVDQFNILVQKLPKQYSWRRTSDAGFIAEYHYVKSSYKGNDLIPILNMYYWRDFCLSIEALSVMTLWRVCDLGRAAAFAINRGDVAVASITARSALESACFLLHTSGVITSVARVLKPE